MPITAKNRKQRGKLLAPRVREALLANPEGLTVFELASLLDYTGHHMHRILAKMPDTYIDRWVWQPHVYAAVWCAVAVPKNCPRPNKRNLK